MDPITLAALVAGGLSIGGSVVGGIMNSNSQAAANASALEAADKNAALQREFAQNGVRWKAADAKAAGLHPLFALGAPTISASPSYVGSQPDFSGGDTVRNISSNMGQDISRAIAATQNREERELSQLRIATAKLDLEGKAIDNQIRASQLRKINTGPTLPSQTDNFVPGQGNGRLVVDKPLSRTVSAPGRPAQEAGWRPDVSYSRTDTGLTPMVPESLSESLEDDFIGKILWRVRNQLLPNVTGEGKPPTHMLPKGATDWSYSLSRQEWVPTRGEGTYPWKNWKKSVTDWQKPTGGRWFPSYLERR